MSLPRRLCLRLQNPPKHPFPCWHANKPPRMRGIRVYGIGPGWLCPSAHPLSPCAVPSTMGRTSPGPPVKGFGYLRNTGQTGRGHVHLFGIRASSRLWYSPSPDVQVRERTCCRKKGAHRQQQRKVRPLHRSPPTYPNHHQGGRSGFYNRI